ATYLPNSILARLERHAQDGVREVRRLPAAAGGWQLADGPVLRLRGLDSGEPVAHLAAPNHSAAISVPLPHDGPRGRPFVPANLDRQHDQIVVTRLHRTQVQPLHDGNPAPQPNLMRPRRRRTE